MEKDSSNSSGDSTKTNTWLRIVAAVVAILLTGGVVAYLAHNSNKNTSSDKSTISLPNKPFDPVANSAQPLSITINTRVQGDKTGSIATVQSDGQGNFNYTLTADGKPYTAIYTPIAYYVCKDATSPCLKYPKADPKSSAFDPSGYTFNAARLDKLKSSATYKGQQPCPGGNGICDVWSAGTGPNILTYYVNTADKKIMKTTHVGHFGNTEITTDIVYAYKDVHVTVPTNYKDAPPDAQ